jgi:hypothetical protein
VVFSVDEVLIIIIAFSAEDLAEVNRSSGVQLFLLSTQNESRCVDECSLVIAVTEISQLLLLLQLRQIKLIAHYGRTHLLLVHQSVHCPAVLSHIE